MSSRSSRGSRSTTAFAVQKGGESAAVVVSPYPSGELVRQYASLLPDAPDRMLKIVERDQDAGIKLEAAESVRRFTLQIIGMVLAFLLCLVAMCGGIVLVLRGHAVSGWASLVAGLAMTFAILARGGREK